MHDLLHSIGVKATPEAVLKAISTSEGLSSWWTASSSASPTVGHVNVFRFGDTTAFHCRVDRHVDTGVHWTCIDAEKVPPEWVGTTLTFDLSAHDGGTRIDFAHRGWQRTDGDLPVCNTTWGELMHRLKDDVEGNPRGPLFAA